MTTPYILRWLKQNIMTESIMQPEDLIWGIEYKISKQSAVKDIYLFHSRITSIALIHC